MFESKIREIIEPVIEEVYRTGYEDGQRRILEAFRYGKVTGREEVLTELGAIDIEEVKTMTDSITYCDVIDCCEDCPRYGNDCDGDGRGDNE